MEEVELSKNYFLKELKVKHKLAIGLGVSAP